MKPSDEHPQPGETPPGFSRRTFFKGLGTVAAATTATSGLRAAAAELEKLNDERTFGPDAVKITLNINGEDRPFEIEPRVTLLDLLRYRSSLTGAKEVCDRATCGACTVLLDGTPVYSCMTLAIEAQGRKITTVEGLAQNGELNSVQKAFIESDALMCGYCTPGFVMSVYSLLQTNPKPTEDEVRKACAGNLCRCGTYPRIVRAALAAAGVQTQEKVEMITVNHG